MKNDYKFKVPYKKITKQQSVFNEKTGEMETEMTDFYVPDFFFEKKYTPQGKYAIMKYDYLKENEKYTLLSLEESGKIEEYFEDIQSRGMRMENDIVDKLKANSDLTEDMKNTDPLHWVGMMNNFRNQAEEIIRNEIIYN